MLETLLGYLNIMIILGRLSITRAACTGPACLKDDKRNISSTTATTLTAATILYEYERGSNLAELMRANPKHYSYRITDGSILAELKKSGQTGSYNANTYLRDAINILSKLDYTDRENILSNKIVEVHLNPTAVSLLNWKSLTTAIERGSYCVVNINLLNYLHPQILAFDTISLNNPDEDGNIIFGPEESVLLSCPSSRFELFNEEKFYWKCFGGSVFHYGSIYMNIRNIKCKSWEWPNSVEGSRKSFIDNEGYRKNSVEMHFETNNVLYYTIVWNDIPNAREIFYTRSVVSQAIKGGQSIDGNGNMKYIHTSKPTELHPEILEYYKEDAKKRSFLLQYQGTTNNRCTKKNSIIAAHLVNPISMVYESLALYTFATFNYAPQWKSISDNNWDTINRHVNKMASHMQKDLTVITGTYGNFKIRNRDDTANKLLFLNYRREEQGWIKETPVKLYFFKIVIDRKDIFESRNWARGVVFVTVNNPYLNTFPLHEICEQPQFPKLITKTGCLWDPKFSHHGYSYTCDVEDFFKKSKYPLRDEITKNVGLLSVELEHEIQDESSV